MHGQVIDDGEMSAAFEVTVGTKQGCVLAALLFCIFFSMMLPVAFKDCDLGIPIRFRTDGSIFNLHRLQAHTKTFIAIISDLLYANDCALTAHTLSDAQYLFNHFLNAATRFGLTVSPKKTEVVLQPVDSATCIPPTILARETLHPVTEKFCYLGSILSVTRTWMLTSTLKLPKPVSLLADSPDVSGMTTTYV